MKARGKKNSRTTRASRKVRGGGKKTARCRKRKQFGRAEEKGRANAYWPTNSWGQVDGSGKGYRAPRKKRKGDLGLEGRREKKRSGPMPRHAPGRINLIELKKVLSPR